ncbi:unnamed protein product [Parascedosporium putredinis]|uniref:MFS general substrate transporter n=1 Tax=Parascedosporium putredinis TaxID=1442378 RepID=A0A9P1M757_9PEZI|nr:unnamed protein product [Parascedosporium putredinis]CAI7988017.1 unnamed protein product [Parascedosporium putredinis]
MSLGRWKVEDRVRIENPLSSLTDEQVTIDVTRFVNSRAPFLSDRVDEVCRAAHVAKHIRFYEQIARGYNTDGTSPPITLTSEEKTALVREKDKIISEHGMCSFGGANVYEGYWRRVSHEHKNDHAMGISNGIAYLAAALISRKSDRRATRSYLLRVYPHHDHVDCGGLLSNFDEDGTGHSDAWKTLVALRLVNGIGMGIKAVSTPILASETAIGYWRGTALLVWQLWVALGIFVSNSFNLIFYKSPKPIISLRLILASPMVPAILLAISLYFTPESPRFYLRPHRGHYKPEIASKFCGTSIWSIAAPKLSIRIRQYFSRYRDLIANPRLRNSTISSCTVALGQQLCGSMCVTARRASLNIFAFYATTLFLKVLGGIEYTGLANFLFGIPAVGTIDTFGPRERFYEEKLGLGVHAGTYGIYSPAMGPVPFTLASEAFPLSHREHDVDERGGGGALGLFAGLNVVAFILVYLLVEETKQRDLEDLEQIYAVPKREFARFQATVHLPWFLRRVFLCSQEPKPDLYDDTTGNVVPPDEGARTGGPCRSAL